MCYLFGGWYCQITGEFCRIARCYSAGRQALRAAIFSHAPCLTRPRPWRTRRSGPKKQMACQSSRSNRIPGHAQPPSVGSTSEVSAPTPTPAPAPTPAPLLRPSCRTPRPHASACRNPHYPCPCPCPCRGSSCTAPPVCNDRSVSRADRYTTSTVGLLSGKRLQRAKKLQLQLELQLLCHPLFPRASLALARP